MKLIYWVSENLTDSKSYNIRTRTKKECIRQRALQGEYAKDYSPPYKVMVEYKDAFDLILKALGEPGIEFPSSK